MVHLKDFSLMSPDIQSADVLKAIETAIPAEMIEQAIGKTNAGEQRARSRSSAVGGKSCNCNESLVERFDAGCTQKLN